MMAKQHFRLCVSGPHHLHDRVPWSQPPRSDRRPHRPRRGRRRQECGEEEGLAQIGPCLNAQVRKTYGLGVQRQI